MKRYVCKNKVWFLLAICFKLLQNIAALGVAVILSILIDTINQQDMNCIKEQIVLSIGYAIIVGVVTILSMKMEARFKKQALCSLRKDVMKGILNKDIVQFQEENSAKYISLCNNNLAVMEENYFKNVIEIFGSMTMIVLAVGLLLCINWMIAIVAIVLSTLPSMIPLLFGKKLGNAQKIIAVSMADYTSTIKDIFNGFDVIKSYNIRNRVEEEHSKKTMDVENNKCKNEYLMANLYGLTNCTAIAVQFTVILIAGVLAVHGHITLGNIIAITQLTGQAITPAFQLSSKIGQFQSAKAIQKEIMEVIRSDQKTEAKTSILDMKMLKNISFHHLSFSYDGERKVINDVTHTFEKNKKYAIVGASGCGKSTLLKLLLKYYDGYTGDLTLDTTSYKAFRAEDINRLCSFLQQSVFLFDDTIENNITLFERVDPDVLANIMSAAGLTSLLEKLPNGIQTSVGECGNILSGGERQRIAIARALLKGSDVLIFDEATSALDNETASYIENTILQMKDVTGIIVTHRLHKHTLSKYDELIVMDNGSIIQTGTFHELLENCLLFQKLYHANI